MWCPEGYRTWIEIHRIAYQLSRNLVYKQYIASGDMDNDSILSLAESIPEEASSRAWAIGNWLMDNLQHSDAWAVSTINGTATRLQLDRLLGYDRPHQSCRFHHIFYNPITTIGPPPPEWEEWYLREWQNNNLLVDLHTGLVKRPSLLHLLGALDAFSYLKSPLKRVVASFVRRERFTALSMARRFGGRALCMKSSDVDQWAKETEQYLEAFLKVEATISKVDEIEEQTEKRNPGRPQERKRIARAILELYGGAARPKSWKEMHRDTEGHLGESFSMSSLKRAFNDLGSDADRDQN